MVRTLTSHAIGAAAIAAIAFAATPASAQDECTPGNLGESATLTVGEAKDKLVTAVALEFQCGDVLSDGTYIPTGYRATMTGECGEAACEYPLVFFEPTARKNQYDASFVFDGADVNARIRSNRRGTVLAISSKKPGKDSKRVRSVYRMAK